MWTLATHYASGFTNWDRNLTTLDLRTNLAERLHDHETHGSVKKFQIFPES